MKNIAVVTGASSGMGREMAIQIGDRFSGIDQIWVVARRGERLAELVGQTPAKIRIFAEDITAPEGRRAVRDALEAENGGDVSAAGKEKTAVRILVNAAGFGVMGDSMETDEEVQCRMIRLNCEALFAFTRMLLPYMGKNSRIIQFASAAAFAPQPHFAVYAATKAFVLSYSRALGAELRHRGICVTAVCPGPVDTEFFDRAGGIGRIPAYKKLAMADPEKVVRKALADSMAQKEISVYGLPMKAFALLAKIAPHRIFLGI